MELFPELQLKSDICSLLEWLCFACPITSAHLHSNLTVTSYEKGTLSIPFKLLKIEVSKKLRLVKKIVELRQA